MMNRCRRTKTDLSECPWRSLAGVRRLEQNTENLCRLVGEGE